MTKYDHIMMQTAELWKSMSTCKRRQVSAIITKDNRIKINGYNGTIKGKSNDCEKPCQKCNGAGSLNTMGDCGEVCSDCGGKGIITNKFTLHAEQNAIAYAAKQGISLDGCTMYVTTFPCAECSKLLVQAGITRVVYSDTYRDMDALEFLQNADVEIEHYVHN